MGARLDVPTDPALGLGFRELSFTPFSVLTVFTSFVASLCNLGFTGGKSPLADPEGIQGGVFAGFRVPGGGGYSLCSFCWDFCSNLNPQN